MMLIKWAAVAIGVASVGWFGVLPLIAADRYSQALAMCGSNPEAAGAALRSVRAVYGDPPRSLRLEVSVCELTGSTDKLQRLRDQVKAAGG